MEDQNSFGASSDLNVNLLIYKSLEDEMSGLMIGTTGAPLDSREFRKDIHNAKVTHDKIKCNIEIQFFYDANVKKASSVDDFFDAIECSGDPRGDTLSNNIIDHSSTPKTDKKNNIKKTLNVDYMFDAIECSGDPRGDTLSNNIIDHLSTPKTDKKNNIKKTLNVDYMFDAIEYSGDPRGDTLSNKIIDHSSTPKTDEKNNVKKTSNVDDLNKMDISRQTDGASSRVCFCTCDLSLLGEGLTAKLEDCQHTICSGCMTEVLESIIADKAVEPRCPYTYVLRCNSLIHEHEIRKLVEPHLYEAYLEKTIIKLKDDPKNRIIHCKKPECKAWYIMESNSMDNFTCTLCLTNNNYTYMDIKSKEKSQENRTDTEEYIQSERYNEIVLLAESDMVPNFESFECPICFVQYESQEGLILKNCLHTFCKVCIANVIVHSETADIKCPYKNDDYSCDENISQNEIKAVIEPDDFQKYLQKSIAEVERKAGKSAFHCKTPNCPDWCFYEPGVDHFLCPTCNEDNCFLCQKIHTGRGCVSDTATDDVSNLSKALIEEMLKNGTALLCPKCNAVITKTQGCDLITCAACKTEICWATRGPRWGPDGKGDTSGGCKCQPYAKCHPSCSNCH